MFEFHEGCFCTCHSVFSLLLKPTVLRGGRPSISKTILLLRYQYHAIWGAKSRVTLCLSALRPTTVRSVQRCILEVFGYTPYAAPAVGAFLCHKTYNATTGYDATASAVSPNRNRQANIPTVLN